MGILECFLTQPSSIAACLLLLLLPGRIRRRVEIRAVAPMQSRRQIRLHCVAGPPIQCKIRLFSLSFSQTERSSYTSGEKVSSTIQYIAILCGVVSGDGGGSPSISPCLPHARPTDRRSFSSLEALSVSPSMCACTKYVLLYCWR
jgi:hypothetical protein